jgi:hypothetical protein
MIKELNVALKNAKNMKSTRLDNILMDLFKFGRNELKVHILELFNDTVDANQIQQKRETGIIINIYTNGRKSKCKNYRGITFLPTAYTLFTNITKKIKYRFGRSVALEKGVVG